MTSDTTTPTPMTADDLTRMMRAALAAERDGIRQLDANAVARATAAKEKVLVNLRAAKPEDKKALILALGAMREELRRNLVLLAHARDYLRDAVELCGSSRSRASRLQAKL